MKKGDIWKVLDHGYVKFIDSMGSDEAIVEAARMSTGRNFISWEKYKRCRRCDEVVVAPDLPHFKCGGIRGGDQGEHDWLDFERGDLGFLEFMYSNKHSTPFEFCELHIEVQAPLMVFREWHRHRTASYSEFSARYAQMPNIHYIPELERIVKQSKKHKQSGGDEKFPEDQANQIRAEMERQQIELYDTYDAWIQNGVANEIARGNTPVSRYSKMRAKTDLRNWLGFLILRKQSKHSKPQWEIAQFADVVGNIVQTLYPRTYALFEEHTLYAETFSRTEMKVIRALIRDLDGQSNAWGRRLAEAGLDKKKQAALISKLTEAV